MAKDLTFQEIPTIQDIINFYKEIKSWGGQVFMIQNRKMVSCCNLPKMIAYMLVINPGKPVKLILEGERTEYMAERFEELLKVNKENSGRYPLLQAASE